MAFIYNEVMTVILAGLYDNGRGAILVSDKARTIITNNGESITADKDDVRKIKKLNQSIYILAAGSRHITEPYIKDLESIITKSTKPSEIIDRAGEIYKKYRDQDIVYNVLLHYNYKSLEEFKSAKNLSSALANIIDRNIRQHSTDFDFIIVGQENNQYTIYGLNDPGYFTPIYDGYIVGGSPMAKNAALKLLHQDNDFSITMKKETVRTLLTEAKNIASQHDNGVGSKTCVVELPE